MKTAQLSVTPSFCSKPWLKHAVDFSYKKIDCTKLHDLFHDASAVSCFELFKLNYFCFGSNPKTAARMAQPTQGRLIAFPAIRTRWPFFSELISRCGVPLRRAWSGVVGMHIVLSISAPLRNRFKSCQNNYHKFGSEDHQLTCTVN